MLVTISLSVEQILRRIYAHSALQTYLNHIEKELPILTPDNKVALARLVGDAFSELVLKLMPGVVECHLPEGDDDDELSLTIETSAGALAPAVRAVIEGLLADAVMAAVFADHCRGFVEQLTAQVAAATDYLQELVGGLFSTISTVAGWR